MHKVTKAVLAVSLTIIVASIGFIGGFATSRMMPADTFTHFEGPSAETTSTLGDRVSEVLSNMNSEALVVPTEASATAGAVQGLLSSMGDKYATYFDATHYKAFNEDSMGSFGGIGVVLGEKGRTTYITEVYKGTPAARAGLKPGDVFRAINGQRRDNWQTTDVVKLVRGDIGTTVTVTMLRPTKVGSTTVGEEKTYTITRDTITYPNLKSEMIGDVGYMRLGQFNANAEADIRKAIAHLTSKGAKALVLDLRSNPGGLLDEAVDVSSLFIAEGTIVRVDRRNKPEEILTATGRKVTDLPLVVLIDGDSASASEITGGALQDHKRATLVGQKSYGKGSVQTVSQLSWGGGIKFTIAHYLTPLKRVIDGKGLTPDVVVKMDRMKQIDRATDTQLKKALEIANREAAK